MPLPLPLVRHRPRVRIGQRDLLVRRGVHLGFQRLERLHLLASAAILSFSRTDLAWRQLALLAVGRLQRRHVALDAGLDLLHPPLSLALVKFLSRVFTALNLLPSMAATAWVNRSSSPAQSDELPAGRPDRRAIVLPEVGDGLEVRRQAPRQPHHLDVALRLALQPPARRDLVDVAVDVDLQQQRRDDRPAAPSPPEPRPSNPSAPRSSSSTNTSITRTGFSSAT